MKFQLLLLVPLLWLSGCASSRVQGYELDELQNRVGNRPLVIRMSPDEAIPIRIIPLYKNFYEEHFEKAGYTRNQFDSIVRISMLQSLETSQGKFLRIETSNKGVIDSFYTTDSVGRKIFYYGDTTSLDTNELIILRSPILIGPTIAPKYDAGKDIGRYSQNTLEHVDKLSPVKIIRTVFFFAIYDPHKKEFIAQKQAIGKSYTTNILSESLSREDWTKSAQICVQDLISSLNALAEN